MSFKRNLLENIATMLALVVPLGLVVIFLNPPGWFVTVVPFAVFLILWWIFYTRDKKRSQKPQASDERDSHEDA